MLELGPAVPEALARWRPLVGLSTITVRPELALTLEFDLERLPCFGSKPPVWLAVASWARREVSNLELTLEASTVFTVLATPELSAPKV